MSTEMERCDLCSNWLRDRTKRRNASDSNSKRNQANLPTQLWSYFYQDQVQEVLLPTNGSDNLPVLTFTFTDGRNNGGADSQRERETEPLKVCAPCSESLETLHRLHVEMEKFKEKITVEVERINKMRGREGPSRFNSFYGKAPPRVDTTMAGSTVGKENIVQTLRFLEKICEGVSSHSIASVASSSNRKTRTVTTKKTTRPVKNKSTAEADSDSDSFDGTGTPSDVEELECSNSHVEVKVDPEDNSTEQPPPTTDNNTPKTRPRRRPRYTAEGSDSDSGSESEYLPEEDPLADPPATPPRKALPAKREKRTVAPPSPSSSKAPVVRNKRIPCKVCSKMISKMSMHIHMRVHTGEKPYQCDICGRRFAQRVHHNVHRRIHTGEKPHQCPHCPTRFRDNAGYHYHLKVYHPDGK